MRQGFRVGWFHKRLISLIVQDQVLGDFIAASFSQKRKETSYQVYWTRLFLTYTAISRKEFAKNVFATIPKGNVGYGQYNVFLTLKLSNLLLLLSFSTHSYVHGLSWHSFKFLWKTVNSKPPTMPSGIVACTLSDNLSQNSCIWIYRHLGLLANRKNLTMPTNNGNAF